MLVDSENIPSTALDTTSKICSNNVHLTSSCNEPLKIILFPPKNKEFRYDGETNTFQVHSLDMSSAQVLENEPTACTNDNENKTISHPESLEEQSGLTPLVETCSLSSKTTIHKNNDSVSDGVIVKELLRVENIFRETKLGKKCFLKGCRWSPDGLCLLTNSDDNILRLFEVPETVINNPQNQNDVQPVFEVKEGGTIYDYQWYPLMNSLDPVSCVFASVSQYAPIHLWDAYTGQLRATYQPINQYDEVTPAYSITFSTDGSKIYSGYKKVIRIFNTSIPGRVSEERPLKVKGNNIFQCNIVSTICINPVMSSLYAIGCYDKTIGLYGEPEGDLLFILKGHFGGVTQVTFSRDGYLLFSGGRKDPEILCWDIRNPGKVVYSISRQVNTQQKIQFDVSDTNLITGTTDSQMKLYNLENPPETYGVLDPIKVWTGHGDCVNGCQFHPQLPLIASVSGQRHFEFDEVSDDEDSTEEIRQLQNVPTFENSLKIWSYVKS